MVMRAIGADSKYPFALRNADGAFLDGSLRWRLHLPANPPVALPRAVTACNTTDGTMTAADQQMPSINGFNDVVTNEDGSVVIWLGPDPPEGAPESNWIQTVEGLKLRLYGTGV